MSLVESSHQVPATTGRVAALPIHHSPDMLTNPVLFEHMQRVAKLFASAELVPAHLRGKTADCFIALNIARRMGEDPIMVLQNIYFVSGRAGWKTEYMIGRANKSGVFAGRINWRTAGKGDAMEVTAFAKLAEDGSEVSSTVSMAMAKAEEWTRNKKYQSMPEHMLRWRSATMLIRLYAPEVMMGASTIDEIADVVGLEAGPDGTYTVPPRPTRAEFQNIGPAGEGGVVDTAGQDEPPSVEPDEPSFTVLNNDGEVVYSGSDEQEFASNLLFTAGVLAGDQKLLEGLWETNSPQFSQLREPIAQMIRDRWAEIVSPKKAKAAQTGKLV